MYIVLTFAHGPELGETIAIPRGTRITIGRSSQATRKIKDSHLSRVHVEVDYTRERAEFRNGTAFRPVDFSEPGVGLPVIKIAELSRGVGPSTRWSETGGRRERRLEDGDVLFAWSGNPQTSIGTTLWGGGPAWLNQHIYQVLPDAPTDRAYLYGLLCRLQPEFVEIARNNQTTGLGHVAKKDLRRIEVLVPPPAVREAFAELSAPLLDGVVEAKREVLALARARDFLLPRLLRGGLVDRLAGGSATPS